MALSMLLCLAVFLLSGCSLPSAGGGNSSGSDASVQTLTDLAMGTTLTATFYTDNTASSADDTAGSGLCDEVTSLLTDLENNVLSWRVETSEIGQINAATDADDDSNSDFCADPRPDPEICEITVSDALASYLAQILDVAENSGGALDPTVGLLSQLWDIGGTNPRIPSSEEIAAVLPLTGYDKLSLDGNILSIPAGLALDLGAVGKGIGCDEVRKLLAADDSVTAAVVSIGGSILTYGAKPDGTDWSVAIRDPRDEDDYLGILKVSGTCCISTSGDYEKYFMEDGTRYHHILDPATGYPADSGLISVTIVCDSGLLSDALSTACFVLGYEESLPLLSLYDAEAIFVDEDKNVYVTDGLADIFSLSAEGYALVGS